jgi:hypothetical protein
VTLGKVPEAAVIFSKQLLLNTAIEYRPRTQATFLTGSVRLDGS